MPPKSFACLVLLSATLLSAQGIPKTITLADNSTVPIEKILKAMPKEYRNISIKSGPNKSDYTLEAFETATRSGLHIQVDHEFDLTLFDPDRIAVSSVSDESLGHAMKVVCHAIKTSVPVEVVDTNNLTQSVDARGEGPGVVAAVVNSATGRTTHTDTASIYVIVKGEHALLDCYERRTGCTTIGPGKYYGERSGDGIWVSYRMPITHKPVRNHYKIAGGW
jgi:hypothetical protein